MARIFISGTILFFAMLLSGDVVAQCGMGVPSAGNPNCIPPGAPGSPYGSNYNSYGQQPVQQQPIIIKHEWADRWGAMVADSIHPVTGFSTGAASKNDAMRLAKADCLNKGGGSAINYLRIAISVRC